MIISILLITTLNLLSLVVVIYLLWLRRKRQKLMKQLEKIRLRIARDLHDDIGATLSSISFYAEAVKQRLGGNKPDEAIQILDKMGVQSREMIGSMNDIVWMVNPSHDGTDQLLERLEDYGKGLFASKGIVFMCYFDPEVMQAKFLMDTRRDLYLICKESLNNAAKYSECNLVEFLVKKSGKDFEVIIKDNGKGFNAEENIKIGNGLLNMKVRAEQLGGIVNIVSEPNVGTSIRLVLPYPHNWG
ncbi:MAG: hypothetical protein FGM41_01870 [Bacteroidetes bacterium]|jgi:two-component system sensor histidine kinase UhpB|nr:hypothetical protein [Bacteroidota bacterium]